MADYYQSDSAPEKSDDGKREESDSESALLPKSFFGDKDLEVGKKCEVKIVHVYEDEVEVEYVRHKKKDNDKDNDKDGDDKPSRRRDDDDDDPFTDERMGAMGVG